jgi:hypothetical protein
MTQPNKWLERAGVGGTARAGRGEGKRPAASARRSATPLGAQSLWRPDVDY